MKIKWQKLIIRISFWLLIEAAFNIIGIDDLADYTEFLLISKATVHLNSSTII